MTTRRQLIARLLAAGPWSFEELKRELGIPGPELEEDLRHLERSGRASGSRLQVEPARCRACRFTLRGRPGRYHPPGRCPRCRSERIAGPWLRVDRA
jgi:hypothetical protein